MRKSISIFCITILMIFTYMMMGCRGQSDNEELDKIEIGDSVYEIMSKDELLYLWYCQVQVFLVDGYIHVVSSAGTAPGMVEKSVEFTLDRKWHNLQGMMPPVKITDPKSYLGRPRDEVLYELGPVFGNFNSAIYTPGYVTDDAALVFFDCDTEPGKDELIIVGVTRQDLVTRQTEKCMLKR